jgi:hypothetical protein
MHVSHRLTGYPVSKTAIHYVMSLRNKLAIVEEDHDLVTVMNLVKKREEK